MNLLDQILNAQGGAQLQQLAGKFGVSEHQAKDAVAQLFPALSQGLKKNASTPGGLDALLGALQRGNHQRYLDNPQELDRPESIADGNNILGHIFGSKEVSRHAAARASEKTGLDAGILKQMLPMLATLAMGVLSKQTASFGAQGRLQGDEGSRSSQAGSLLSMLDFDRDGSVADDLLGIAKKFF